MPKGVALTENLFKAAIKERGNIKYISGFENGHSKCEFKCLTCKNVWSTRATIVLYGAECPKCSNLHRGKSRRKSHETFVSELQAKSPEITCLSIYITARDKLEFEHTCGARWFATPRNVLQGNSCPKCANTLRSVNLGRRQVNVKGYEPQALKHLLLTGVKAKDIAVYNEGSVPSFRYKLYGTSRLFCPDFMVVSKKQIVEVKSLATLGVTNGFRDHKPGFLFAMTKAKAKAVLASGYRFSLLVMDKDGNKIKMPRNWLDLSRKEIADYLGIRRL